MNTFDKLRLIKLTKNNCQILLNSNDGFIINTTYNSNKGEAYKREYKIFNGKLHIHERKNTDSSHDNTWIATDKEVHQFLEKYLWKLSLDGITVRHAAILLITFSALIMLYIISLLKNMCTAVILVLHIPNFYRNMQHFIAFSLKSCFVI